MDLAINLAYILASILFVFGIKMLGSADTARQGNRLSALGMFIAVIATLLQGGLALHWIALGLLIGAVIGVTWARKVEMTGMPELVALFNGFGGLASLLVGAAEYAKMRPDISAYSSSLPEGVPLPFVSSAIILAVIIGGITFTGSIIAFLKLSGRMGGQPTLFFAQKSLNALLFAAAASLGAILALWAGAPPAIFLILLALALALGILGVLPIGGGDMPVVIAFLNSCSGIAASAAGFVILNNVLIVAGCLVGASGLILTVIMCKAMNRTLANVFFGGFGATSSKQQAVEGEMRESSVQDAYFVLEAAQNVIIVPGYGMAVAQAQHAVKELGKALERNGTQVRYAIHPVAGRMPGHMNVLLAEADVAYEQLCEMDEINASMDSVDVAIVIGANDVVNPAAANDPSSPIYGMPIINVHQARTIYSLKRGQGAGFSGLVNTLFFLPNNRMLYGDAKDTVSRLAAEFSD